MARPRTLHAVVNEGDHKASLEALRGRLAREIDRSEGRDVAPLAKQLADVLRELHGQPVRGEASVVDELAERAARRRAAAGS